MQLIDCDAAINYSCNRSVMESNSHCSPSAQAGTGKCLKTSRCWGSHVFLSHVLCNVSLLSHPPLAIFLLTHHHILTSPPPNAVPPLLSPSHPSVQQLSLNVHQPLHQHQSQEIKMSNCPFSCWYSLPDRCTDVCFYPMHLGNKLWHCSLHTPSFATPFVALCIFLYGITVLIGEIVVYGGALEFQEIMGVVLSTNLDRKSLGNGERSYPHNDPIPLWTA